MYLVMFHFVVLCRAIGPDIALKEHLDLTTPAAEGVGRLSCNHLSSHVFAQKKYSEAGVFG